jgi:hypothetical protein
MAELIGEWGVGTIVLLFKVYLTLTKVSFVYLH